MAVTVKQIDELDSALQAIYLTESEDAPKTREMIARVIPSQTRIGKYLLAGEAPMLEKVNRGEWTEVEMLAANYALKNHRYGRRLAAHIDDVDDETISLWGPNVAEFTAQAAEHPELLAWLMLPGGFTTKCFTGQPFFSTTHPFFGGRGGSWPNMVGGSNPPFFLMALDNKNRRPIIEQLRESLAYELVREVRGEGELYYTDGILKAQVSWRGAFGYGSPRNCFASRAGLTDVTFKALRNLMRFQKDSQNRRAGREPTHIVVGPTYADAAEDLFNRETISGSNNPLYRTIKVIVNPYVEDLAWAQDVAEQPEQTGWS